MLVVKARLVQVHSVSIWSWFYRMKRIKDADCLPLEMPDPVCRSSIYPPIDELIGEATALALCGLKPSKTRERSQEWLQVVRGETYRQPGVLINNWFDEGQDIVHLKQEKRILSDVWAQLLSVSATELIIIIIIISAAAAAACVMDVQ